MHSSLAPQPERSQLYQVPNQTSRLPMATAAAAVVVAVIVEITEAAAAAAAVAAIQAKAKAVPRATPLAFGPVTQWLRGVAQEADTWLLPCTHSALPRRSRV